MHSKTPLLKYSELDSNRFGFRVYRGNLDEFDEAELHNEIVSQKVDIAIVRTPAGSNPGLGQLFRFGLSPIHADTLVYHEARLSAHIDSPAKNIGVVFEEANAKDLAELSSIATKAFSGYVSHYSANPYFEQTKVLAGYTDWSSRYLSETGIGNVTWVAKLDGAIVAFAGCTTDSLTGVCEIALNAVRPDQQGKGLYGDLIRHVKSQFRDRGYTTIRISTQLWNYAVQKVWGREGFTLLKAYDTYHINTMMAAGHCLLSKTLNFHALSPSRTTAQHPATSETLNQYIESELVKLGVITTPGISQHHGVMVCGTIPDEALHLQIRRLPSTSRASSTPLISTLHSSVGALRFIRYDQFFAAG